MTTTRFLTVEEVVEQVDRFRLYESLLLPLENVKQDPRYHPEGDALYHSLQVFQLAREALPYDEEFLTAALLHEKLGMPMTDKPEEMTRFVRGVMRRMHEFADGRTVLGHIGGHIAIHRFHRRRHARPARSAM